MTDLIEPQGPDETGGSAGPLWKRLAWFWGIAIVSVTVVAATAYILRGFLFIG
ncbi:MULTISPECIES: DUF2474 domain-containing protein [Henriciella]|jgi:hypothetical protein|uniref:DUF2474 domain-containing protein n=1 Tax=Henriciella algicola TaxID=1608422 RepID=A0A399R8F6_9PROT|nr:MULTISPECIES: DUF2474 domain-containing protein [Henriciella]QYI99679.1 hypothetical protein KUV46_09975 [Thalassovita mediterranea]RIJ27678.1 DUF2474 domain-containing protein [Henriciella algicola]HIG23180.1 DUF2474 domain-containing protein [Henriciella sp.]